MEEWPRTPDGKLAMFTKALDWTRCSRRRAVKTEASHKVHKGTQSPHNPARCFLCELCAFVRGIGWIGIARWKNGCESLALLGYRGASLERKGEFLEEKGLPRAKWYPYRTPWDEYRTPQDTSREQWYGTHSPE